MEHRVFQADCGDEDLKLLKARSCLEDRWRKAGGRAGHANPMWFSNSVVPEAHRPCATMALKADTREGFEQRAIEERNLLVHEQVDTMLYMDGSVAEPLAVFARAAVTVVQCEGEGASRAEHRLCGSGRLAPDGGCRGTLGLHGRT